MKFSRSYFLIILSFVFFLGVFFVPTGYNVIYPGNVVLVDNILNFENDFGSSNFYIVPVDSLKVPLFEKLYGVSSSSVNLAALSYSLINSDSKIEKADSFIITGNVIKTLDENEIVPLVLSFNYLEIEYSLLGEGVEIVGFSKDSYLINNLEIGDIIYAVNGVSVSNRLELINGLKGIMIGDDLSFSVLRDGRVFNIDFEVVDSNLGIFVKTKNSRFVIDNDIGIDIDLEGYNGNSADLMITLGLLDRLSDLDLSSNYRVSGSCSLDLDYNTYSVGNVDMKIKSAIDSEIDIFFVSIDDYNNLDMLEYGDDIEVFAVSSLDDAIDKLLSLK
jgi:PDZ domain-containing secreted protein